MYWVWAWSWVTVTGQETKVLSDGLRLLVLVLGFTGNFFYLNNENKEKWQPYSMCKQSDHSLFELFEINCKNNWIHCCRKKNTHICPCKDTVTDVFHLMYLTCLQIFEFVCMSLLLFNATVQCYYSLKKKCLKAKSTFVFSHICKAPLRPLLSSQARLIVFWLYF